MNRSRAALSGVVLLVVVLVLLGVLWSRVGSATALYLSRPHAIWDAFTAWIGSGPARHDIWVTLAESGLGFLLAVVCGILLAVLVTRSRLAEDVLAPFIAVANALPKIALAPLFLLLFGVGFSGKVYFVAIAICFIPFYALYQAILSVRPVYVNHARAIGAGRMQLVRDVFIPSVLAPFVASLRVTVGFALLSAIVSEFIAAQAGVGFEMVTAEQNSDPATLIAGVIIIAIIAIFFDLCLRLLVRRMARHGIET